MTDPGSEADTQPPDALPAPQADALSRSLVRMGLVEAGERPRLTPLAGGVSSLIARVDTRHGTLCVKRALERLNVAAHWEAPVERNVAEVRWMRTVQRLLPGAVPEVLGHDEPGGAFAMRFLPPSQFPVWKDSLAQGRADPSTAAEVARRLAAIHSATAHVASIAAEFDNERSFRALRLDPYFGEVARRDPECAPALQALIGTTARARIALVHGDASPKNIVVGPGGPVFLDAECATFGDPAFDLAFCLNHLLLKQLWVRGAAEPLRACFDAAAGEYLERVAWESPADFERRAAALLPALLLARVDGKSPVEYLDARDRALVRDVARPMVLAPPTRLAGIALEWKERLQS